MSVRRNDPCPCGSGRKYKRCCGDASKAAAGQSPPSVEMLIADAYSAAQAGDYRRAERSARLVLKQHPRDLGANHICGVALAQLGDLRGAEICFEWACKANPAHPLACCNLGRVRELLGNLDGAEVANRRALEWDPSLADAYNNLGNVMRARGRVTDAVNYYRKAVELGPNDPSYAVNLAGAHLQEGEFDKVEGLLGPLATAGVPVAAVFTTLGLAYLIRAQATRAVECFEHADALSPNDPQTLVNLGAALAQLRRAEEATAAYERAFAIDPASLSRYAGNLMNLYLETRDLDRAHALAVRVLADPQAESIALMVAANVFGSTCDSGRRDIVQRASQSAMFVGETPLKGLLECHYSDLLSNEELWRLHLVAAAKFEQTVDTKFMHEPDPGGGGRRLRIGYLSPDFRDHATAYFMLPIFSQHSRSQFEICAYHTHPSEDSVTESVRNFCQVFRNISALTEEEAANLIHRDGIDILVDLAGHTAGSRPGVLARRPAPVQATYLGYPDTTGLMTVDYVILDSYIAGGTTRHVEAQALVPECLVTFSELPVVAADAAAPVNRNGFVTFGSLNNLSKLTASAIACWAEILRRVPASRILIAYTGADAKITQENLLREFARNGIGGERVLLRGGGTRREFLEHYRDVDILLDTFPYTGTTTTCEALLMNVPVVTLTGGRQCNRVSASILHHIGLANLVAQTLEDYVRIAVEMGTDVVQLVALRKGLPARLKTSTLQDSERFTRGVEALYRAMWEHWAAGRPRGPIAVPARARN